MYKCTVEPLLTDTSHGQNLSQVNTRKISATYKHCFSINPPIVDTSARQTLDHCSPTGVHLHRFNCHYSCYTWGYKVSSVSCLPVVQQTLQCHHSEGQILGNQEEWDNWKEMKYTEQMANLPSHTHAPLKLGAKLSGHILWRHGGVVVKYSNVSDFQLKGYAE